VPTHPTWQPPQGALNGRNFLVKIVEVGDFGRAFLLQKAFGIWGIDAVFISKPVE